jgi:hypothetical protein
MQKVTEGYPLAPGEQFQTAIPRILNPLFRMIGYRLNRVLPMDGTERMTAPLPLYALTTANLPAASSWADSLVYVTDGVSGVYQSDGSTWSALGAAGRNILINGDCEVWQRGAGGSASIAIAASSDTYGPDRWFMHTFTNETSTVSQVAGLTSGSRYSAKFQRNSGQTGTTTLRACQPLTTDQVVALRGSKVTLSAVLQAGANYTGGTLTMAFYGSPRSRRSMPERCRRRR